MSTPTRGLGSRNPGGRPRKVASKTHPVDAPVVEPAGEEPVAGEPRGGSSGGRRTTIALVVAIALLLGVAAAEAVLLTRDDSATVSASRPVVVGDATRAEAVRTAAQSTEEILSTSFESYDEQLDQAAAKMTDAFAAEVRRTSEGIRDGFLAQRTRMQMKAVGQSVVQASAEQAKVLLFLDQYVEKRVDGEPTTDFAQYRALVTVVHTDQGWLVSDIETQ